MNVFSSSVAAAVVTLGLAVSVGCHDSGSYEDARPPTDSLVAGNTGIQAKDVTGATDRMANDLLALPELNASQHQWTIVITGVQNHDSTDPTLSYDAFNGRLRSRIAQLGHGRVTLIENKATYHNLQNQELEGGGDQFGQGGTGGNSAGVQPDYGLYITVDALPGRASDYYNITATLTNLHTRVQVWVSSPYEFQSAR